MNVNKDEGAEGTFADFPPGFNWSKAKLMGFTQTICTDKEKEVQREKRDRAVSRKQRGIPATEKTIGSKSWTGTPKLI